MYKKILVPSDGGSSSNLALSQAIIVAKAFSAEVKVIFVADDSELFFEVAYVEPADVLSRMISYGRETLDAAAQRLTAENVRCSTELIEKPISPGQISSTIVSRSESWNADLIVMGTHGRRGMKRFVMGSVSEGVVAKSIKPVLLIRSERSD